MQADFLWAVEMKEGQLLCRLCPLIFKQISGSPTDCSLKAVIFQVVPWYVKVYYHSLEIFIDGSRKTVSEVVDKIHVIPSEDKLLPGTLEMLLRFPCSMQSGTLTLDFDKVCSAA